MGLPAMGQRYEYMSKRWADAALQLDSICEADAKECLALNAEAISEFFAVGPPWVVRFQDLQRAAPLWQAYTPRIRRTFRSLGTGPRTAKASVMAIKALEAYFSR